MVIQKAYNSSLYMQKQKPTWLLPRSAHEYQWKINNFRLRFFGLQSGDWLQTVMNKVLAAY